jgi:hypothetical protein
MRNANVFRIQNISPFPIFKEQSSMALTIRPEECASTEYTNTREECAIMSSRG